MDFIFYAWLQGKWKKKVIILPYIFSVIFIFSSLKGEQNSLNNIIFHIAKDIEPLRN